MAQNKTIPIILMIVGISLLLGAGLFALDRATSPEPDGLGTWILAVLGLVLGASTGVKGWLDWKKKDTPTQVTKNIARDKGQIATGDHGRNVRQGDSSQYIENYHAPSSVLEIHDTIGFIPPAKVETYIHRGKIEEDVVRFIREGGKGAIVGVHAPGGLGKTELAKQVADELNEEFEILWVDVGEKEPLQVVGELLIKCGIQTQPADSYERLVNELRHAYQNHRFLVIMDDVRQASLVNLNELLPPYPCAALVTSRIQQMGGVRTFPLDSMNWEQANELFKAILGNETVDSELETVRTLAERCKFNPLAMEIAARRIRQFHEVKKPVERYFEIAQAKFSELKMEGDARWDMEHIFDISYSDLSEVDRERFRILSSFHPTGFSLEAVSFLWKTDPDDSRQILNRFINLSLVKFVDTEDSTQAVRYRLHDLLDEYATAKLKAGGNYNEAKAALAQWLINLFDEHYTDDISTAPNVYAEKDNLLYSCEWARGEKQAEVLALLTTRARNWFYVSFTEAWVFWYAWLEACLQLGISDKGLKANVLQAIGDVQQFRKETDAALASYEEALTLFRQVGAKLGEANTYLSLGSLKRGEKDFSGAKNDFQNALDVYRNIGDQYSQARALYRLGDVFTDEEKYQEAVDIYEQAVLLWTAIGVIDLIESVLRPRIEEARKQL